MIDAVLVAQEDSLSLWYRSFQWLTSDFGRATAFVVLASVGVWFLLPPRGRHWQFWCGTLLTFAAAAMVIWLVAAPTGVENSPPKVASGDIAVEQSRDASADGAIGAGGADRLELRAARLTRDSAGSPLLAIDVTVSSGGAPAVEREVLPLVALGVIEALIVLGALGTICSRSPLYSAIWFAVMLLGVGGVMLLNGAQFLGLATVAVYAGAIVVTFLFVLMLAQPAGHAFYDRISWGWSPALCASIAGALVVGLISMQLVTSQWNEKVFGSSWNANRELTQAVEGAIGRFGATTLKENEARVASAIRDNAGDLIGPDCRIDIRQRDTLNRAHVASFGGQLFSRHLISVEVAGVLLLLALVGAIAMASFGAEPRSRRSTQAGRVVSP